MPRKHLHSLSLRMKPITDVPRTCPTQRAPTVPRYSGRSAMPLQTNGGAHRAGIRAKRYSSLFTTCVAVFLLALCAACVRQKPHDPSTVTFVIETMPANLDPRIGTDTQSQRIAGLRFAGMVSMTNVTVEGS